MAAYTAIDDSEAYFQVQLYTGNGSANHAITLGADTDMQPDLVWIKNRDATDSYCLFDSVRGATKVIHSNTTDAEATDADTLDSFTSDGFQVDADVKVNTNAEDYVAWCWKESATSGFDIIAYTGNGTSGRTVSHNLSAVPECIIIKPRDQGDNWRVYHKGVDATEPEDYHLQLQSTGARTDSATMFNDTAPTSSVFTLGDDGGINGDGNTFIAYCFTSKQGFSKFGSYVGNGSTDGTFIYTGFRPAFIMIKITTTADSWQIFDTKRSTFNLVRALLSADLSSAEEDTDRIDILSNGFKSRTANYGVNYSGDTYVYMAFAEAPFANSNGVPCNAR